MANGTFGGGNGASNNPYLIEDIADLDAIRNKPTLYYKLTKNLDMKVSTLNDVVKGWTPIPNFTGYFDGNYHNLRNLWINDSDLKGAGLFANLGTNAQVRNLGLIDVNVIGNDMVGSLVGQITGNNVTIDSCYVNGTIKGNRDVGGLIGQSRARNLIKLSDLVIDCDVTGTSDNVGGIAGEFTSITDDKNQSTVTQTFSHGTVKGDNFITTNGCFGLADNLTAFSNCYYDSEKVSPNYPDEHAEGHPTEYYKGKNTFARLTGTTYTDGNKKIHTLYTLSLNDYPRLSFANQIYTLFKIDDKYHYYDTTQKEFVEITDSITADIFFEKGISDISILQQILLHNTLSNHTFNVYTYLDASVKFSLYPTFKIFTDKVCENKVVKLITISPENHLEKDYNPVSATTQITTIGEKEATIFPLNIANEVQDEIEEIPDIETKIIFDIAVEDEEDFDLTIQSNSYHNNDEFVSAFNDERTISIFSSEAKEYEGVELKIGSDTNNEITEYESDMYTNFTYDKSSLRDNIKGNVFYTMYNTITTQNRGVHVNAEGENKSRYLLSVSNGKEWLRYNTTTNTWVTTNLADIHTDGVTLDQLTSRAVMNSLPTNYLSKVKYAVGISAEAFNTTFHVRDIDIEFEANSGPSILESRTLETDTDITVSGIIFDNENDKIKYRILTKHQIETEWTQLIPSLSNGWLTQNNNYNFKHSFPISTFKNGSNALKIQTQDARGAVYEKILSFTLIQGTPEIKINSNNQFYVNATITQSQNKKVHYQIYINGEQKAPLSGWTEWKQTPFTFDYTWNTEDVLNGLPNEIEIVVEDEMSSKTFTKFNIIGEYKSLLFKDENNFYYSTDTGEVLQQLDFSTVVGGVLSNIYPVYLENKTGLPMENITVFADAETQELLSKIKVSFTSDTDEEGFVPAESILYNKILENNESIKFYVRIDSDDAVASYKNKVFRVLAKGDPIDSNLINPEITQDTYTELLKTYNVLEDGAGLYNVQLTNLNDTVGIANMNIFVAYDKVYITNPKKVTQEEFMKVPISDDLRKSDYTTYKALNPKFEEYSIDWLNEFFKDKYGDTFDNLYKQGKITFDAKIHYSAQYNGRLAWLAKDENNINKIFINNWASFKI